MGNPLLKSYTLSYECDRCGCTQDHVVDLNNVVIGPHKKYGIDFDDTVFESWSDQIDIKYQPNDDNPEWICYDCQAKEAECSSYPTLSEHNRCLAVSHA